jgi:hypothetical protein
MLGVTLFGLFLTPVFYVALRTLSVKMTGAAPLVPVASVSKDLEYE